MKKSFLTLLLILALICSLLPTAAYAEKELLDIGEVGDFVWSLYSDNSLVIAGKGELSALAVQYKDTVESLVIGSEISAIAADAFSGFSKLKTVIFEGAEPESLGDGAFSGCADGFIVHVPRNQTSWTASEHYNIYDKTWRGYPIHFTDKKGVLAVGCETDGYTGDRFCNSCNDYVQTGDIIKALGHKSVITNAKEPTCIASGYTGDAVCTVCRKTQAPGKVIPPKGHIWDVGQVITPATETEQGWRVFTCLVCQSTRAEPIEKLDHIHVYEETYVEATCTKEGYLLHKCACGDSFENARTPALGHDWGKGKVTSPATEIKEGVKTYKCSRCNAFRLEVIPVKVPVISPFSDVAADVYYAEPVVWAHDNSITGGIDAEHFNPNGVCTRAHVVTFLWRLAGSPEPQRLDTALTDIKPDAYYYKAVLWALENGITTGYEDGSFRPNNPCTRAHVVTFLWRHDGRPAAVKEIPFTDIEGLSPDFILAIKWAASTGVTTGYEDSTFRPNSPCTRAHVVTFLWRDFTLN